MSVNTRPLPIVGTDEFESVSSRKAESDEKSLREEYLKSEWAPDGSCWACDTCLWHVWDPKRKLPVHCRGKR